MLQLFETQLIVAVIWTMEVSQNLKIFNYSMRVTPPMMNQFLKRCRGRERRVVASDTQESDNSGKRGHGRGRELGKG